MKSVFEYTNYRECIRDFYEEQKARKALSWASFAESAGIKSPVFLQYVCEGKKNLGERTAPQVAQAMGLAGFESTFFCKLVALDNAKSESDKKEILESIAELARVHKVKPITAEEYQFFKSWKNSLIRELAPCMDGANPKEISRATRYRVKTGEVREILEFLQEAGYLTQDAQGNYRQADRSLRMGKADGNSASKTVQKAIAHDLQVQMAELATDALKNDPAQGRNITGLTLGITREAYDQISAGRPTVIHVSYGYGEHWIALIGYQNASDPDHLSLDNFIALDPWDGAQITASDRFSLYGDGCEHISER